MSRFGDTVRSEFYLKDYQSANQLTQAINGIGYRSLGNGRNVQQALNVMRTQQFVASQVRIQMMTMMMI